MSEFQAINTMIDSGIIFETDFCGDVDDVGALALLCNRVKSSNVPLLGISINVNHPCIVPAIDRVLSFLGHKQTPLTVSQREENRASRYLDALAYDVPKERITSLQTTNVVDFYKNILGKAPDHSISIISVGFFCNMDEAFRAMPDLFERKVRCIYVMAGSFLIDREHIEYNVVEKKDSAIHFLRNCHCPMVFIPYETGADVITDLRRYKYITENPIVTAYSQFTEGSMLRPSWDPITVDFAFSGENEYYGVSPTGNIQVSDTGLTRHEVKEGGRACYLYFKKTDEEIGKHITEDIIESANLRSGITSI